VQQQSTDDFRRVTLCFGIFVINSMINTNIRETNWLQKSAKVHLNFYYMVYGVV